MKARKLQDMFLDVSFRKDSSRQSLNQRRGVGLKAVFSIIFVLTLSVTSTSNHNYRLSASIWLTLSTLLAAFSKNLARQGTKKRGTLSKGKY